MKTPLQELIEWMDNTPASNNLGECLITIYGKIHELLPKEKEVIENTYDAARFSSSTNNGERYYNQTFKNQQP